MAEINYVKTPQGLIPSSDEDWEKHNRFKQGALISGKFSEKRNGKFHRKFFGMLDVGYDAWEPPELNSKWGKPEKNRIRFRKDMIIKAGYYFLTIRLDLTVSFEADSMSFANMPQDEFERLYSNVANVVLKEVLGNYTKEDLENVVSQILSFV